ncbi:MAG: hypothetical protein AAGB93_13110 [Planctomycetota bacterium]
MAHLRASLLVPLAVVALLEAPVLSQSLAERAPWAPGRPSAGSGGAAPFTEGNVLAVRSSFSATGILREYTRSGGFVQEIPIEQPPGGGSAESLGVAVDALGRAHLVHSRTFGDDYLSTFDPETGSWQHNPIDFQFGNVSDGDLTIRGDRLYTKREEILLGDFSRRPVPPPAFGGVGEIAAGRPGRIHALDSGSPRWRVRTMDPVDFSLVEERELRDSAGFRLDMRGLAVAPDGELFAVDWDGRIYRYSADATYIGDQPTLVGNPLCIDIAADGALAVGGRFGEVAITDTTFSGVTTFQPYSTLTYVAFVPARAQVAGFEVADGTSTAIENGREVQGSTLFGRFFAVDGAPVSGLEAAVFDSSPAGPNAGGTDPDLLVDTGNLLILQERPVQTTPGVYDFPDDDLGGGTFRFDFQGNAVTPRSLDLVDICAMSGQSATVRLFDAYGRTRTFTIPDGWTEDISFDGGLGYRTLDLRSLAPQRGFQAIATGTEDAGFFDVSVVRMEIELSGSGAVDGFAFLP